MGTDSDWMGPSPDYDPANDPAVTSGGPPEWHNLHGKKQMTSAEYRGALSTLGLSQLAAVDMSAALARVAQCAEAA